MTVILKLTNKYNPINKHSSGCFEKLDKLIFILNWKNKYSKITEQALKEKNKCDELIQFIQPDIRYWILKQCGVIERQINQ